MSVDRAAETLLGGGIIAYPTEGVFGLGCLPDNLDAVERLLGIKQRDRTKGFILIGANAAQFDGWINLSGDESLPDTDPENPVTWIVPAGSRVASLIRGDNDGIAIRITTSPVAQSICTAVQSPIVSTSANLSDHPVVRDQLDLHRQFRGLVDYIVPGDCGPSSGPSEIRILATGKVLRPR